MYGITKEDKIFLSERLKLQQKFLDENFVLFDDVALPLSSFYFSSWHNSARYIAELNTRVSSMEQYASDRNLEPIFCVFTLPSAYHCKRSIKLKNGGYRLVRNENFVDDEEHSVCAGAHRLQMLIRSIMSSKAVREIPAEDRCYITTKEPHKDGTCHLNLLFFVPVEFKERVINIIKKRFISDENRIETDIRNATGYIMKYIFKTLDDLRDNPSIENLSDISFWYLKHRIRRVTMSKTFISLEIYRKVGGKFSLIELTKNYSLGLLTVLCDIESKKPVLIYDNDFGDLWVKKKTQVFNPCGKIQSHELKSVQSFYNSGIKPVYYNPYKIFRTAWKDMSDERLKLYWRDNQNEMTDDILSVQDYAMLENEMIERGFLQRYKNHIRYFTEHALEDIRELEFKYSNNGVMPYPF